MPAYAIILIIIAALLLIFFLYRRSHPKVVVKPVTASDGGFFGANGGVKFRHAAEYIPVYGTIIKAVGYVGKPINNVLDKANNYQTKALQHIPVVGKYLAMPTDYAGKGIKKLNSWLGL